MNTLTKAIVSEVAAAHKNAARRNDDHFRGLVEAAWWDHLLVEFAQPRQARFYDLLFIFRPDFFETTGGEPYLRSYEPRIYDLEVAISHRLLRWLKKEIDIKPQLQLDDWGEYPKSIADPQMKLF